MTILLLEPDDETRPLIVENLCHHNYRLIVTLEEKNAIELVKDGRDRPDLILINQVGRSLEETIEIGRRIRQRAKLSSNTIVVVIAERYGSDLEGTNVRMGENEYVTYLEDGQQLFNLLHRLDSKS